MGLNKIPVGETKKVIAESGDYNLEVIGNKVRMAASNSDASDGRRFKTDTEIDLTVQNSDNGLFVFNPGPSEAKIEVADQ